MSTRATRRHLLWIPSAAAVGFLTSFVFADWLRLPTAIYHAVYFIVVIGLLGLYARWTRLPLGAVLGRRIGFAIVLGVLGGLALVRRVLADPTSAGHLGVPFVWDVLWRGVLYGAVDGALLSSFPWLVTWRALDGEGSSVPRRVAIGLLALGSALLVTSAYHAGYRDFRGPKLAQANLGNAIASLPTLLSLNPLASPITHAILHVAAVVHNPQSDLFLPPHAAAAHQGVVSAELASVMAMPVVDFPLRGTWKVFQPPGHNHHAFDFVAVDHRGEYSSQGWRAYLLSGSAADWYGWSAPVYAPFEGTIVAASDHWPDRTRITLAVDAVRLQLFRPTIRDGDLRPLAGNHIMIQSSTTVVLLAHLRRGSLTVARGERVRTGQLLGAVGNSGNSLVPHLHFEVLNGSDPLIARRIAFRVRAHERWTGQTWEQAEHRLLEAGERVRYLNRAARTRNTLASLGV